jgi:MFS family permease
MKAWRPSMWIPLIMIAWGVVMIGMGFVQNFAGLLAARIILGVTEAGLFPGIAFFLTQWYRRFEISLRVALFFSAATIAGAFGGLLARLINLMDGAAGYEGWRWIFILEGIATVVIAVISFWMMHDYPDTAKFLTPAERKVLQERLKLDTDGCSGEYKKRFIRDAFLDWKSYFFGVAVPLYCFSLFSPTIIKQLGYTAGMAQLMSVPPYVAASIMTIFMGWLSDRLKTRAPFIMCFGVIGALGYGLLLANISTGVSYFALFLGACGIYPAFPIIVAWGSNNFGGSLKKSVATGILICSGNSGGVASSFLFPAEDGPRFMKGHGVCIGFSLLLSLTGVFWWFYAGYANKKKTQRNLARGREWTAEEKLELQDEGDHVDWFFYTR